MLEIIEDWAYLLERSYPNLHGAGMFFIGAMTIAAVFGGMYLVTRKKTHLLVGGSAALYMLPFVM